MFERFASYQPLFDAFAAAGYHLYLVGGCVRDVVMGLDALGDVDLATDALPEQTKATLIEGGFRAFPIGETFGTITTLVGDVAVEITTLRVGEVYQPGSRHPQVEFGKSIEDDLSRRDLSVNAMAMGPDGVIIDPFDGHRAIRDRILEVPGGGYENTMSILRDDPLRLLRIGRFAARFGFNPTDDTSRAAREVAGELRNISRERWRTEMEKILVAPQVGSGLSWLHAVGALGEVLPEAAPLSAADIVHTSSRIVRVESSVVPRWATLLLSALELSESAADPLEVADATAREYRFSNKDRKALSRTVDLTGVRTELSPPTVAYLRRFYADAPEEAFSRLEVARALADGEPSATRAIEQMRQGLAGLLEREDPIPRFPRGLGCSLAVSCDLSGSEIGAAMSVLRDAVLDGEVPNGASKEAYIDYWKAQFSRRSK